MFSFQDYEWLAVMKMFMGRMMHEAILIIPDLDQIVTSTRHKPANLPCPWCGADDGARCCSWRPTHRVHAHTVRMEDLMSPAVIAEF